MIRNEGCNNVDQEFVFSEPNVVSKSSRLTKEGDKKYKFATPNVEDEYNRSEDDEEENGYSGYETDPYKFLPHSELDAEVTATGKRQERVIITSDLVALYPSVTSSLAGECTFQARVRGHLPQGGVPRARQVRGDEPRAGGGGAGRPRQGRAAAPQDQGAMSTCPRVEKDKVTPDILFNS